MSVFPPESSGPATGSFSAGPSLSAHDRAARLAVLAGGTDALYQRARTALSGGDPQWAAVLADHLLMLEPERLEYGLLKAAALRALGSRMLSSASWRGAARRAEAGISPASGSGEDASAPSL